MKLLRFEESKRPNSLLVVYMYRKERIMHLLKINLNIVITHSVITNRNKFQRNAK